MELEAALPALASVAPLPPAELPIPTIFIRAAAQNIDIIVAAVVAFVLVLVARALGTAEPIVGIVGYSSFALAFLAADALPNGQSVGKRLFGLAVREVRTGRPCSFIRSITRNVFVVTGLIDWLFMLGRSRRRLGDYAAGTRVIRVR